jgi:AcrR family transcriptional regulator
MPSSLTQNRRERERQERYQTILDAARSVYFSKGITNTTMDDVAAAAEVSKGTVYRYFSSRQTILLTLLQEGLVMLVERLETAYSADEPLPASTRLRRLALAYLFFFQTHPHYYRLLMAFDRPGFIESIDPDLYEHVLIRSTRGLAYVVQAIEQGVAEGELVAEDPKQAAGVIWSMLHGVYVILGHPLRREMMASDLESLYNAALEMAIKGLMADSRKDSADGK